MNVTAVQTVDAEQAYRAVSQAIGIVRELELDGRFAEIAFTEAIRLLGHRAIVAQPPPPADLGALLSGAAGEHGSRRR